jgi:hypothetical protein
MSDPTKDPTQVVVKPVHIMHCHAAPNPMQPRPGSEKPQHGCEVVVFQNSEAFKLAKAAQDAAIKSKWPDGAPPNLRLAIKDPLAPSTTRTDGGPSRRGQGYADDAEKGKAWYIKASSQFPFPVWIGKDRLPPKETDTNGVSGGRWIVGLKFAPYSSLTTGHGVTCYLQLLWRISADPVISAGGGIAIDVDGIAGEDLGFDDEGAAW